MTQDESSSDSKKRKRVFYDDLSGRDTQLYCKYTSAHSKYHKSQSWKLFQEDDYDDYYMYGITMESCSLDGTVFTTNTVKGRKSHFYCSKKHQLSLLNYCVQQKIPLPQHIMLLQSSPLAAPPTKKRKLNTITGYLLKNPLSISTNNAKSTIIKNTSNRTIAHNSNTLDALAQAKHDGNVIVECKGFEVNMNPGLLLNMNQIDKNDTIINIPYKNKDCLNYDLTAMKSNSNLKTYSSRSKTSSKASKNKTPTKKKAKLKSCDLNAKIKYKNCKKENHLKDTMVHQLLHFVNDQDDAKAQEEDDDDDDDDDAIEIEIVDDKLDELLYCFLCGDKTQHQCNLNVKLLTDGKIQIITDCLPSQTFLPFKTVSAIANTTATNPWSNPAKYCTFCKNNTIIWKWNMRKHDEIKHSNIDIQESRYVSEFEQYVVKCVVNKAGKQRKRILERDFEQICLRFPNDAKMLWKDRFNEYMKRNSNAEKCDEMKESDKQEMDP